MQHFGCDLHSIDATDIDSLFGLLGYIERKGRKKQGGDVIEIGGKRYFKKAADSVSWL